MPLHGRCVCPAFNPFIAALILRFFTDLEALFSYTNITDETNMKRHTMYYSHMQVEYI